MNQTAISNDQGNFTLQAEPTSQPTVFLVDDDAEIRTTLSRALRKRDFQVRTFASAREFLDTYDTSDAGCLVLDYGMPDMNGLELQANLLAKKISIPIIFITGHGGIPESVQAMKAGAVDFLEKPFRQHVLVDCISAAFIADGQSRTKEINKQSTLEKFSKLTNREKEIANFMIANPSNTASKEIGRELDISPRTVDHHRARILEKMDIKSVAELIDFSMTVVDR
jgi:FixJ family two-component response regulator